MKRESSPTTPEQRQNMRLRARHRTAADVLRLLDDVDERDEEIERLRSVLELARCVFVNGGAFNVLDTALRRELAPKKAKP